MIEADTSKHLNDYGEAGLRTLALSYRVLDESEYSSWNAEFLKAKTSIGPDRELQLERVSELIERDLILVGATAVEDKLQSGVRLIFFFILCVENGKDMLLGRAVMPVTFLTCFMICLVFYQVPQCIDRLAQAGLKIWVLTGDKMETAINIG